MSSKEKKEKESTPFISLKLVIVLLIACTASGLGTYYFVRPAPAIDPHAGNPNVKKLSKAFPKDKFKAYRPGPAQKYQEHKVFPYIKKNQTPVKDCYFGYKGKFKVNPKGYLVTVQFSVAKNGKIKDLGLLADKTQLKEKPILECILKKIYKWQLPPHKLKKKFTMRFPFFFR